MTRKNKWYLRFSLAYLALVIFELVLFGLSLEKVPLNFYGIRRNFFDSRIQQEYYPSGLYHKDIGYYFLLFPSSNKYLQDISLNITNKDMQTIGIKYTLVYQLFPNKIYTLYSQMSMEYQTQIIAIINSIISNYFTNVAQKNTRVSVQSDIVTEIGQQFGNKLPILKECVQIKAFWLNQMDFYEGEIDYETAFRDANSYSEAYEQIQIQLQKMNLKVETLKNLILTIRHQISINTQSKIVEGINQIVTESNYKIAQKVITLSQLANVSQIFQYYRPPKLIFK